MNHDTGTAAQLATGTTIIKNRPFVLLADGTEFRSYLLTPAEAERLGLRLIALAERALTDAVLQMGLVAGGMEENKAQAHVAAFNQERSTLFSAPQEKAFTPPS
jgi:hypothetical protein